MCIRDSHTTEEVAAVVKIAAAHQIPLTVRGAGTSLSGGPVALQGGILLEMTAFRRILELNAEEQYAVVEPGVITNDLIAEAGKYGLFYPCLLYTSVITIPPVVKICN